MSLEAELDSLILADVLNVRDLAELYAVPEDECPILAELIREATREREELDAGRCWPKSERHGLFAAEVAVRALLLTAMRKPLPALGRFLRELSVREFNEAVGAMWRSRPPNGTDAELNLGRLNEFSLPLVWEAERRIRGFKFAPDDLAEALVNGIYSVCPVLTYAASRRAAANLEDNQL